MAGKAKKGKAEPSEARDRQWQELTEAVAQLREEIAQLSGREAAPMPPETSIEMKTPAEAISIQVALGDAAAGRATIGASALSGAVADVARLGSAFDTPAKVELVRALLPSQTLGAAALSGASGLTTGSLYHHLRDLIHAGVVEVSEKNRYRLTPRGRYAAGALFALTRI